MRWDGGDCKWRDARYESLPQRQADSRNFWNSAPIATPNYDV
jgi:hypothetical protein